jgi:hypothetical protein
MYKSIRTNKSDIDEKNGRATVAKYILGSGRLNGKEVKFFDNTFRY